MLTTVGSVYSDSSGVLWCSDLEDIGGGALRVGLSSLWSALCFAVMTGNNQLFLLCHTHFSAFYHRPWMLPLSGAHSSLRQGCSWYPPIFSPPPPPAGSSGCRKHLFLFLPVYHSTPRILSCGSFYLQIPHSHVLVWRSGVFCWILDAHFTVVSRGETPGAISHSTIFLTSLSLINLLLKESRVYDKIFL